MTKRKGFTEEVRESELEHYHEVRSDEFGYAPPANERADKEPRDRKAKKNNRNPNPLPIIKP